jgi:hypothetical protein
MKFEFFITEETIKQVLNEEAKIEYQINHHVPTGTLTTSEDEQKRAKQLWDTRPPLILEKYHEGIVAVLKDYVPEEDIKKNLIPLLNWRGIKRLNTEMKIDLMSIFKAWRHELAEKMSHIFLDIDADIKTEKNKYALQRWLKTLTEYYPIDADLQKAKDLNVIMILAVTRALLISGDHQIALLIMQKIKADELFKNVTNYSEIERLKGNGYRYKRNIMGQDDMMIGFGVGMDVQTQIVHVKDSELPAAIARMLNLVFTLEEIGQVKEFVNIIKNPDKIPHSIQQMQNQIAAQYLMSKQVDFSTDKEKARSDIKQLSSFFPLLNYTELSAGIRKELMRQAYTWELPQAWFPILLGLQPIQMSKKENYEFFGMCFTLLQHLKISEQSDQLKEQAAYRVFLHLTFGVFQESVSLTAEVDREFKKGFGARWLGNLSNSGLSGLSDMQDSQERDDSQVEQIELSGKHFYHIVKGLQSSGLFRSTTSAPVAVVLEYSAEEVPAVAPAVAYGGL